MPISKNVIKLRKSIEKAIDSHQITHEEYERILAIAFEGGFADNQEQVLLKQLQQMIENRIVIISPKKQRTKKAQ